MIVNVVEQSERTNTSRKKDNILLVSEASPLTVTPHVRFLTHLVSAVSVGPLPVSPFQIKALLMPKSRFGLYFDVTQLPIFHLFPLD